jgi:hypothetical protein
MSDKQKVTINRAIKLATYLIIALFCTWSFCLQSRMRAHSDVVIPYMFDIESNDSVGATQMYSSAAAEDDATRVWKSAARENGAIQFIQLENPMPLFGCGIDHNTFFLKVRFGKSVYGPPLRFERFRIDLASRWLSLLDWRIVSVRPAD